MPQKIERDVRAMRVQKVFTAFLSVDVIVGVSPCDGLNIAVVDGSYKKEGG